VSNKTSPRRLSIRDREIQLTRILATKPPKNARLQAYLRRLVLRSRARHAEADEILLD
jgi:hypothetical protein